VKHQSLFDPKSALASRNLLPRREFLAARDARSLMRETSLSSNAADARGPVHELGVVQVRPADCVDAVRELPPALADDYRRVPTQLLALLYELRDELVERKRLHAALDAQRLPARQTPAA
jgi:hypothetical protein